MKNSKKKLNSKIKVIKCSFSVGNIGKCSKLNTIDL